MFLSVFDIFKIGIGPSSSHTMGPMVAAGRFLDDLRGGVERIPGAGELYRLGASLHGSLAYTGKGHATDRAVALGFCGLLPATLDPDRAETIEAELRKNCVVHPEGLGELRFDPSKDLVFDYGPPLDGHPNGLILSAYDRDGHTCCRQTYYSVGGGFVLTAAELERQRSATAPMHDGRAGPDFPYPFETAAEMLAMGKASGSSVVAMKRANEALLQGDALDQKIDHILKAMDDCVARGLSQEGVLPGGLNVRRRAKKIHDQLLSEKGRNLAQPHHANDWMSV